VPLYSIVPGGGGVVGWVSQGAWWVSQDWGGYLKGWGGYLKRVKSFRVCIS